MLCSSNDSVVSSLCLVFAEPEGVQLPDFRRITQVCASTLHLLPVITKINLYFSVEQVLNFVRLISCLQLCIMYVSSSTIRDWAGCMRFGRFGVMTRLLPYFLIHLPVLANQQIRNRSSKLGSNSNYSYIPSLLHVHCNLPFYCRAFTYGQLILVRSCSNIPPREVRFTTNPCTIFYICLSSRI